MSKDYLPIYIDVDGTLTDRGTRGGNPIEARIQKVRELIASGEKVVIWSATGFDYVVEFMKNNNIVGATPMEKPKLIIDDNPNIRPKSAMPLISPEKYFQC